MNDALNPPSADSLWMSWGFDANPFQTPTAEQEPRLLGLWLPPTNYEQHFPETGLDRSVIVAAPRGVGKSAIKKYLYERFIQGGYKGATFIVPVAEFSDFLDDKGEVANATEDAHCRKLLSHLAWELAQVLANRPNELKSLSRVSASLLCDAIVSTSGASELPQQHESNVSHVVATLGTWFQRIRYDINSPQHRVRRKWLRTFVDKALKTLLKTDPPLLHPDKVADIHRIRELWHKVARPLGFERLRFVVNRIDEPSGAHKEYDYQVGITKAIATPLVSLIRDATAFGSQDPDIVIKILLWDAAAHEFQHRLGKITLETIYWTDTQIVELIRRRLMAYSASRINDIRTLVEPEIQDTVLSLLVRYAQRIPRLLNSILLETYQHHVDLAARKGSTLLRQLSFDRAVRKVAQRWTGEDWKSIHAQELLECLKKKPRPQYTRHELYEESGLESSSFDEQLTTLRHHGVCIFNEEHVRIVDELFILLFCQDVGAVPRWELPENRCPNQGCGWPLFHSDASHCAYCQAPFERCPKHRDYLMESTNACPICDT